MGHGTGGGGMVTAGKGLDGVGLRDSAASSVICRLFGKSGTKRDGTERGGIERGGTGRDGEGRDGAGRDDGTERDGAEPRDGTERNGTGRDGAERGGTGRRGQVDGDGSGLDERAICVTDRGGTGDRGTEGPPCQTPGVADTPGLAAAAKVT